MTRETLQSLLMYSIGVRIYALNSLPIDIFLDDYCMQHIRTWLIFVVMLSEPELTLQISTCSFISCHSICLQHFYYYVTACTHYVQTIIGVSVSARHTSELNSRISDWGKHSELHTCGENGKLSICYR